MEYKQAGNLTPKMNLCIFLTSGKTFSFKDVEILTDNESVIVFSYSAMSDGKQKMATFFKSRIAGVSRF